MAEKQFSNQLMRDATSWLLAGGVIGPPLFIIVFLIEGATRPGYSPWRNYVSSLSLSSEGWMQVANFIICGVCCLGFALGLRRSLGHGRGATWGPLLLAVFSLGLLVAGVFATDPNLGYPPGSSVHNGPQTLHGTVHGLAGLVVFTSLPAACFVLARRFAGDPTWRGWALYSVVTGVLMLAFFVASTATSALDESGALPNAPTGLLQRAAIVIGFGWVTLLAARLLSIHRSHTTPAPHGAP
jgi:hypothetical protein